MKKIVFLTGTRADFGKIKSLIKVIESNKNYTYHIFATGMHLNSIYGSTVQEIYKSGFSNVYEFTNQKANKHFDMDITLSKTILGFSNYIKGLRPDLIVIHGDRVEALAGAIVGSLNNILTAHIEGGELSGTIDDLIRHSASKLSHIHFVSNKKAKKRLMQMGELSNSIFVIGSPDVDLMNSKLLPDLQKAKSRYEINFNHYAIAILHPVTTEIELLESQTNIFFEAIEKSLKNFVVIYPNNDLGNEIIIERIKKIKSERVKIFPSIRFEYFLTLLKNASFILGNSSTGIREAAYFGINCINVGSRQSNRSNSNHILNVDFDINNLCKSIQEIDKIPFKSNLNNEFGNGNSDILFLDVLQSEKFWETNIQKQFQDI